MDTTNLQIPIRKDLKIAATKAALEQGFSSLQEAVRVFINKLAKGMIDVAFMPKAIKLSPRLIKKYNKIIDEVEKEKGLHKTTSVDDLIEQLNA